MLWRHNSCPWRYQQNFIVWLKLYCRCGHTTKTLVTLVIITSILWGFHQKKINFFEGYSWFRLNNLGLVTAKVPELKVREVLGSNSFVCKGYKGKTDRREALKENFLRCRILCCKKSLQCICGNASSWI